MTKGMAPMRARAPGTVAFVRAKHRCAWSRRVGEQLRGETAERVEMHIDDLPEDVQGAVRSAASMVGADVNDPDSLKAILLMILGANEEKSTTREDIDYEAGDWDSDDAADENSPTFEISSSREPCSRNPSWPA